MGKEDELRERKDKLLVIEQQLNDDFKNESQFIEVEDIMQSNQRHIEEKESIIQNLCAELEEMKTEMDKQKTRIEEFLTQLQLKDILASGFNESNQLEFNSKDNLIRELNTEIENKAKEIQRLSMKLEGNETLMHDMNEKVLTCRNIADENKAMEAKLDKNNKSINDLSAQLKEKDIAKEELKLHLSKLEEEVAYKNENLFNLESD